MAPSPPPPQSKFKDYLELMRLHRGMFGGILFVWPCVYAVTILAIRYHFSLQELLLYTIEFGFAAFYVHVVACVLNELADIEIDRQIERTKNRPLAAGRLKVSEAINVLVFLVLTCCAALSFGNTTAMAVGVLGLFPLHTMYPFLKRWTHWPQLWLGIAVGWGFPFTWVWIVPDYSHGDIIQMAVMLTGITSWCLVYDTQYGCQDRKDDEKIGAMSTAVLFGNYIREFVALFAAGFVICLVIIGSLNHFGLAYYLITCFGSAVHFVWQIITWKLDDHADCNAKFKANGDLGYLIWAGFALEYFVNY